MTEVWACDKVVVWLESQYGVDSQVSSLAIVLDLPQPWAPSYIVTSGEGASYNNISGTDH